MAANDVRQVPFDLLGDYTFGIDRYFVKHEGEGAPSDLGVFQRSAEHAREQAKTRGELDDLLAAIDFALTHDDDDLAREYDLSLAEIINSENYQPEEVLKPILAFYRSVIAPDAAPLQPGGPVGVEMVKTPLGPWRAQRAATPR